jgi:hypothetical protein
MFRSQRAGMCFLLFVLFSLVVFGDLTIFQMKWHEGYTCSEWDEEKERMKNAGHVDDDESWIEQNTKPCPKW